MHNFYAYVAVGDFEGVTGAAAFVLPDGTYTVEPYAYPTRAAALAALALAVPPGNAPALYGVTDEHAPFAYTVRQKAYATHTRFLVA